MYSSKFENNLRNLRIALVYDRVNKWGGAEQILLALRKLFPEAPLFTSVCNLNAASWAKDFDIQTSFLQKLPFAPTTHEAYAPFMPLAFESFDFDSYDVVISVTSEAAKGIITKPYTKHICICLTPTRYLWSGYEEYFSNTLFKILSTPVISYLRTWDKVASQRPDYILSISETVAKRVKKYYHRDSPILYPPSLFKIDFDQKINTSPYFLVVSRLVKYKRIDLAIQAANKLRLNLKIVGEGRQRKYLERISGKTIEFLGHLSDKELAGYYTNCKALIFPGVEDFGLVMVEAQKCGKPVIAYKAGGALEILQDRKTGEFFENQTVQSLSEKLEKFDEKRYNSKDCIENAERFSYERFEREFKDFFDKTVSEYFKSK